MLSGKVVYIYKKELIEHCNKLPSMENRASLVQDLIMNYKLLSHPNVSVVESSDASQEALKSFHSTDYVDLLKSLNYFDSSLDNIEEKHLEYGLAYDCPIFSNIYDFATCIAGGSLSAARLLAAEKCRTVINWFGGWHHAQRDSASGFCYINDIVIAIQFMSKTFSRILYVDLDIHHGDGVQNAFEYSNKILTLSFHKHCAGFFPNTGGLKDIGKGRGQYYSINIPLMDGVGDKTFTKVFEEVFPMVCESYKPQAVVVQCGADGLNGDPVGQCNLTLKGFDGCIQAILACDLPRLFLGGGGYNFPNTARLWTHLTSLIIGEELDNDIPGDTKYFCDYAPSYELHIEEGRKKDCNTPDYIKTVINTVRSHCSEICLVE
ncbi:unnamed protein product [Ceutorhynchus assimilis]|uniref:Histone deacetylase n=1 Tax=Ceutorhynchus assimilis TaxID=467358 RepID=A0A9N9QF06_9CUCU|nr:unnamed protein product [Ceutorhynchus assimilis]